MTKLRRRYSEKTYKILFALSGNQCAYPECRNPVIIPPTEESGALVLSQICHIYALSEDGPRGKAGLTEEGLNAPDNLILFCPTHHTIVDGQYETYPAELLIQWKKTHEALIQKRLTIDLESVQKNVFFQPCFPTLLVDQNINDEVELIRKSRFFVGFDTVGSSLALVRRLIEGELNGGSNSVRSRAIAWCTRFLSSEHSGKAEEYLAIAKKLDSCPEVEIADAFICSQKGDKITALSILADINSALSRSAALMIVANHEGPKDAIDWLKAADIDVVDLDPDGKYFLVTLHLQLKHWEAALACINVLNSADLCETPALHQIVAITRLISTVPDELRAVVLNQLPFDAANFPLFADVSAINARREALDHFIAATEFAQLFNCIEAATIYDEYALWLELRDPDKSHEGKQKLKNKLRDPKSSLRLVHLGLRFGMNLDLDAVEREIERQIALHGKTTYEAAMARFALAFTKDNPEDIANYIVQHYEELIPYFDKKSMQFLQIEMLSKAGLIGRAKECLAILLEEGLSEAEEGRLKGIIAEAEGANPIEIRKEQFKQTNSLDDLMLLIVELEAKGEWNGLCEYSRIMFERTMYLPDAERLAKALINAKENGQLVEFIKANQEMLEQSKRLQMLYCWALYHEGNLVEAQSELAKVSDDRNNPDYRALQVNLGITSGDWNSLTAFVANECLEKNQRNAQELIGAAQLALQLGCQSDAKELTFLAADKGNDDVGVLVTAYFLATNAGWENDVKVYQWLNKAVELSGEDGPIQKKSLKDVFNLKPDWDRRESETWQLLSQGDIPMFLAAESLNKTLIQMMIFPALANLSKNDPRRRVSIPAYSGNRQPALLDINGTVAMDATTLLTLSYLNLLDVALDAFKTVYIPHLTLSWLFEEKQKASFHQPSRIKDAQQIQHLLAIDVLEKLKPSIVPDSDLSAQVGDDLALLIAEAEKMSYGNDTQRIVVRPFPVHRIASLMEEEADLTDHAAVLSSCQAIVDKLWQKDQIISKEEEKARDYFQLQEKPWPNQPEIADGAILYLDDLAITYFLHLGLLKNIQAAGFRLFASPRYLSEANELISYQDTSENINSIIESIRLAVNIRIKSGKIKVGRRCNNNEPDIQSPHRHPTLELFALARDCEAILIDDRFLNQHSNINVGGAKANIFSTLDLLDALVSIGSITNKDRLRYRTRLRRAGYCFIPVSEEELAYHLNASKIENDKIVETAELKAIRENILRVRMNTWIQLPKETAWLDTMLKTFIQVLKGLWNCDTDLPSNRARSNWIISQIDVRGWAHRFESDVTDSIVKTGYGNYILLLLLPPADEKLEIKHQYWNWIEDMVLAPIKEANPDLFSWIIKFYRREIANMEKRGFNQWDDYMNGSPYDKSVVVEIVLELIPPLIRATLIEDEDFLKEYSLLTDVVISFNDFGVSFQRFDLFDAVRKIHAGVSVEDVADKDGQEWELKNICGEGELPSLVLSNGKQRLILHNLNGLSPDRATRLRYFEEVASDINLPGSVRERWRNILLERALEDNEIDKIYNDFDDTPVKHAKSIENEILSGHSSISSLVPTSHRYYERLIGAFNGSASINEYAAVSGRAFFEQLSTWRPYDGFLFSLFLSSHSALTFEINVDKLGSEELIRAFDFMEKHGDRISQMGAIEVGLRIVTSNPELEPILIRLIEQIRDDDVDSKDSGFKLMSALFVLVDGELSRIRLFTSEPPFYRRLGALSQAALIHRQFMNSGVDIESFCNWAFSVSGVQYCIQSFADMRMEPRWNPENASPSQIKEDFFGRIMFAAMKYEQNIKDGKLYDLILSDDSESIRSRCNLPFTCYPGPLEGADNNPNVLPAELAEVIKTELGTEELGPSSFVTLVNVAQIYQVGTDQADLAARALKFGNYRIANMESRLQLLAILNGLATVATVARSCVLADELRILVRRYRNDAQYTLSIEEVIRICLVAASSRADLNEWRNFVGDWLTELAFGNLEGNDGNVFRSYLQVLCHIVPELWVSCGRVDAALMAYKQ